MSIYRKVLLADPVMMSHSLLYYRAALASSGFEETEFTVATLVKNEAERNRLQQLAQSDARLKPHVLGEIKGEFVSSSDCWREFRRAMRGIEHVLRNERFDLVAYLFLDRSLTYFAFPFFRPALRAHFLAHVAGLIFGENGLRPPTTNTLKARVRSTVECWLLGRALRSGALRKVAFLDHWCVDRARQVFKSDICGYGVDPVFFEPCDTGVSRVQLGVNPNDFVFLIFGTMADRKGAAESLALLREANLPPERTTIIVAGPSAPDTRARLAEELAATAQKYKVIRHDRFIQNSEMPPYFAAADCVVCVYKEFTGSSNVLIHGAIYGKLALVSPGGVMEDAVRRHNFGEVASLTDPKGFIAAARKLATLEDRRRGAWAERARAYGRSMDARRFMSQFT